MTRTRELLGLASLVLVASVLRLPSLATRAAWDADQGHDMLVLRAFVRDGVVPLLGPPTSIGDVHHGAAYYFLLAPAAWLTGGDSPFAVTFWIALLGVAAVALTWWLARAMGGPVAGIVAGLAMAVSAASVEESTFIWNPNVVALTSGLALAGAWAAWSTGRARWWLLAALGTALTVQGHVLGVVLAPVVVALFVADVRIADARRAGNLRRAGLGALVVVAVLYLPLAIHELTTGGAEARAMLAYLGEGGGGGPALPLRLAIVALRVVGWPLAGLITSHAAAVLVATAAVIAIVGWRWSAADRAERVAVRWLGLGLIWSAGALAIVAPSLASVVPGLPNDHYHAFADPMVFVLVGLGAAAAVRASRRRFTIGGRPMSIPLAAAALGMIALVGWNLANQPPSIAPGGTFAESDAAAQRIVSAAAGRPFELRSLPDFKTAEAIAYPLVRAGRAPVTSATARVVVVLCDPLFASILGATCGGAAEDALLRESLDTGALRVDERFSATPRSVISIYAPP